MRFFSASYEIVAHDVAGSTPSRYLTDGAFQDEIWEEIRATIDAPELEHVDWAVRERYVRGLAITDSPERVAVLASVDGGVEDGMLRLCTRVMRHDGTPLACGYLTLGAVARESATVAPYPRVVEDLLGGPNDIREVVSMSFAETVHAPCPEDALFPAGVRALAARVAAEGNGTPRRVSGRPAVRSRTSSVASLLEAISPTGARVSGSLTLALPGFSELAAPLRGAAFTFPDARSYDGRLLRELHAYVPYLADHFHQADDVARRFFRQEFLPLVEVETLALHDQRLERCPELAHLGVVVSGVLIAETLQEHGIRPEVLVGDGLGGLTALAVAGAIDVATALRLAAQRVVAMRRTQQGGNGEEPCGSGAVTGGEITFATPRFQIFLSGEETVLPVDADFGRALATWLTRVDNFEAAVAAVRAAGCEELIECGPAGVLELPDGGRYTNGESTAAQRQELTAASVPSLRRPESREDARA